MSETATAVAPESPAAPVNAAAPTSLLELIQSAGTPPATPAAESVQQVTAPVDTATATPGSETTTTSAPPAGSSPPLEIDALVGRAREILGEDPAWLAKHKSVDDFLKTAAERERQVGEQAQYVGAFRALSNGGVTRDDLELLLSLRQRGIDPSKAFAPPAQQPNSQSPAANAWQGKFLRGRDAEGKPIFSADAPVNAPQLYAQWQQQLQDMFAGPETFEQSIDRLIQSKIQGVQQQTLQQTQAQIAATQAADQEYSAAVNWTGKFAKDLFVNGQDKAGGMTPLAHRINDLLATNPLFNNAAVPLADRLEFAKNYLAASATPQPAVAAPSPKAKTLAQPNGHTPGKMPMEEFFNKYRERGAGLAEYVAYTMDGQLPA